MRSFSLWRAYSYAWITLGFFAVSLIGHWIFGWFAFAAEEVEHGQVAQFGPYFVEMLRDTLETWQSEFLQLLWQVGGLAFLLFVGSPQSKEGSDRVEAKIDAILERLDPEHAREVIEEIDRAYYGRHTEEPHGHRS